MLIFSESLLHVVSYSNAIVPSAMHACMLFQEIIFDYMTIIFIFKEKITSFLNQSFCSVFEFMNLNV